MSTDSLSAARLYRKNATSSSITSADHCRYSKKHRQSTPTRQRSMSVSEESSGDILTDLCPPMSKEENPPPRSLPQHRPRRHSELKPSMIAQISSNVSNNERRNSIPQSSLLALLPNFFRSTKHAQKNCSKDEINTFSNETTSWPNDMINGSRTNLSAFSFDDSTTTISLSLFTLDGYSTEVRSAETLMLDLLTPKSLAPIYREDFYPHFHTNYCGEFENASPYLVSLRYRPSKSISNSDDSSSSHSSDNHHANEALALIRTPTDNYKVSLLVNCSNEDRVLQSLFEKADLPAIQFCKPIGHPKANEKICEFDKINDERQNCKIGFVYQARNQSNEFELFANDGISDDFRDFLQLLADQVRLKGFSHYRGDLDVRDDLHGLYSYHTIYDYHEIMFNIAPMIPSLKANGQCIERKGLVGNSFVVVVFQEDDTQFSPDMITGKVTQVYITVRQMYINDELYFKIDVWHRHDLSKLIDPPGGIIKYDRSFRDYFLTLLLNSVDVAIHSPSLRTRVLEQRQRLKQEELKKLSQTLTTLPLFTTITSAPPSESTSKPLESRPTSRTESFISVSSSTTSDNSTGSLDRTLTVPEKKKRFTNIFGMFSNNRASPPSIASIQNDLSPVNPQPPTDFISPPEKEKEASSIKRKPSVKPNPAPSPPSSATSSPSQGPPPIPTRRPVTHTKSLAANSASFTNVSGLGHQNHESPSMNTNTVSHSNYPEHTGRNRSNSTPAEAIVSAKLTSLTISPIHEETQSSTSLSDDESTFAVHKNNDIKVEHPPTVVNYS